MPGANAEYNPLDYANLTRNCVQELMRRGPFVLPLDHSFERAGVYALFYRGEDKMYGKIRSADATWPIYVGKAIPPGGRKGGGEGGNSRPLFGRLAEHTKSIEAATNLDIAQFTCRYLVVTPLWITMAERFLLEHFQPVWNVCIEGFGNHDPGAGRHNGEITWWDALHPGRTWARNLRQTRSSKDAQKRLAEFLKSHQKRPIEDVLAPRPMDEELTEAVAGPAEDDA
jgi:hypothetical protein